MNPKTLGVDLPAELGPLQHLREAETSIVYVTRVAKARAAEALELVKGVPCQTQQDIEVVHALNQELQAQIKTLEADRTRLTKSTYEALENDRAMFREPLKFLQEALGIGQKKIEDCRTALLAKQQAALEQQDVSTAVVHQAKPLPGMTVSKRMAYEVINAALVPEKFKMINHSALQRAIEEGELEISGVRIYPSEKIGTRRAAK
jgi:hypothetical protein